MHIKPENRLHCPKCPFVTKHKHNLEYHLRNHFGSKPFKSSTALATLVDVASQQSKLSDSKVEALTTNSIAVAGPVETTESDEMRSFGQNGPAGPKSDSSMDSSPVPSSLPCKFYKTTLIQIDLFCLISLA